MTPPKENRRKLNLSKKADGLFRQRGLQPAAAHSLRSHVCRLRRVFSAVHAAGKNGFDFISLSAESETLRG
jgi:hypothetical protein